MKKVVVYVASYADAWIESTPQFRQARDDRVASYADAWIERAYVEEYHSAEETVASYADAWIESLSVPSR